MSNPKWEIGPVELVGGREAIIDAINEDQEAFRYTGRVRSQRGIMVSTGWHANGRYMYASTNHPDNLAPPPKKTVRVQVWVNVYADGRHCAHASKESALAAGENLRFACIEIDRIVTEGEGL